MAVVFLQQRKVQKGLLIVFALIVFIIAFVIWQGFFEKAKEEGTLVEDLIIFSRQEVKIDFEALKDPFLEELQGFSQIQPLAEDQVIGRENPFLPYSGF